MPSRKRKSECFLFDEIEEDIHCCFKSSLTTSTNTMSSPESRNSSNDLRSFTVITFDFHFVAAAGCSDALARFACCSVNSSTCVSSVGTVFLPAFER